VEAGLLAEDGERSPLLLRLPSWRKMESAPHPYESRPTGGGWGALPIPVEATLLAEDGKRSPSLWRPPSERRTGSAPDPYGSRPPSGGRGALPIAVEDEERFPSLWTRDVIKDDFG
jgi:hypothetical protein